LEIHKAHLALLNADFEKHLEFAKQGKEYYQTSCENAIQNKKTHLIIDGSQSFYLPLKHYAPEAISMGKKLEIHVYGVGNHQFPEYCITLTPETALSVKSVNAVITNVHHYLFGVLKIQKSNDVLEVFCDNCTRENKNFYLFSYFWILVHLGMFSLFFLSF